MSDALINGLAGAAGGMFTQLITYPLQTINTRQQMERCAGKWDRRCGTVQCMCQVIEKEGWGRLYGGFTPSIVGTAACQGVYYYFYQIFRNIGQKPLQLLGIGIPVLEMDHRDVLFTCCCIVEMCECHFDQSYLGGGHSYADSHEGIKKGGM